MQLVQDFLEQSTDRTPEKTALVCGQRRLTYAEVDAIANRLANGLRHLGVRRGDRVAFFLPNGVELVAGIFGALKADGVFVVVNNSTKLAKLAQVLNNCEAAALVAPSSQREAVAEILSRVPSLQVVVLTGASPPELSPPECRFVSWDAIQAGELATRTRRKSIDQDLACLIYTSGSTGEPKGVMSAHANVVFAASSIIHFLENTSDDIVICALPLSFDYGLYQLLMTFKFGGTLVLERGFAYPAQFLKRIEAEQVTGLPGVPTIFSILLQMDLNSFDLSSLRYLTNTAAALPVSHIEQIRRKIPRAAFYSMYGLTETKRTLYLPPEQLDKRPSSVGIAIPGTEVWLEDDSNRRLGPNEVGELVVRGGHVMRGYWGDEEATANRYRPGVIYGERVCYSGDLFRMDDEGFFYFVGRKDDIIKSRGEKVSPKEVENVLHGLEGVLEAAVVGVPDEVLGQAVKAVIVAKDGGLTEEDILRHCRAHLEDFMVPKQVVFIDTLPKSANGKIQRSAIL